MEEEEEEEGENAGGNAEKRAKIEGKAVVKEEAEKAEEVALKDAAASPNAAASKDDASKDAAKIATESGKGSSTKDESGSVFQPPAVVAAPKKVDKSPPKRCSDCRAILDNNPNLKIRENEPVEAVEEVIALTDPRLAVEGMDCEDRPTVLVTSYRYNFMADFPDIRSNLFAAHFHILSCSFFAC